jgi:flagellar protein FliS
MNRGTILAYNDALSSYKETRIKTASQGQLVIILYDEAVKQLNSALDLLELNSSVKKEPARIEQISKAVMKTEEIITELMVSLDFEQGGEISKNLFALYTWFNRELLEANIAQDTKRLKTVRDMLVNLRGTWNEIFSKANVEPAKREAVGLNIAG